VSRFDRPVLRVATAAVLLMALGLTLTACGRKGPLDPPPGSEPYPQSSSQPSSSQQSSSQPGTPTASGLMSPQQQRDLAPPGPNRRLPIDALLD